MTYRLLADSGCHDGTCPTFYVDTETGTVLVRGYGPDGVTEIDVTIPQDRWTVLMSNLAR